jgi:hypothetical protein
MALHLDQEVEGSNPFAPTNLSRSHIDLRVRLALQLAKLVPTCQLSPAVCWWEAQNQDPPWGTLFPPLNVVEQAGFGHVIQSLLKILIGVGLAVLAAHPNSKFYAYLRCDVAGTYTSRSFPRYTCTAPVHGNAMQEIKEPDWKVLRRVHPLALERFCERVLAEIDRVSRDGAKGHHARYLQIFRIIQQRDRTPYTSC